MLEDAARVQMIAEAVGELAPEFSNEDIAGLREQLSKPDQFAVNFNYLARRVGRGGA